MNITIVVEGKPRDTMKVSEGTRESGSEPGPRSRPTRTIRYQNFSQRLEDGFRRLIEAGTNFDAEKDRIEIALGGGWESCLQTAMNSAIGPDPVFLLLDSDIPVPRDQPATSYMDIVVARFSQVRLQNIASILHTIRTRIADNHRLHLMVQSMEAWLLSDPDALMSFASQRLAASTKSTVTPKLNLPTQPEELSREELTHHLNAITTAFRFGNYSKPRDSAEILIRIDAKVLQNRCPRAALFFQAIRTTFRGAASPP